MPDIRFYFGPVKVGFREDTAPSFVVTTLSTMLDGYRIVNHTDVGSKNGGVDTILFFTEGCDIRKFMRKLLLVFKNPRFDYMWADE